MKYLTYSLLGLAMAGTAAQAQDSGPPAADQSVPQAATPPAPLPDQSGTGTAPGAVDSAIQNEPATAATATPTAQTGVATGESVSDAEVTSYAEATMKVQEIAKNATLDDSAKQEQMAAAVTDAGLQPARFNEISKAASSDADLRTRIQTAMAAHAAAHDG